MRNALQREWARWQQERAKRKLAHQRDTTERSAFPWLDRLRWLLLPLLLACVLCAAWYQLHQLTQAQPATALPIILDAPLTGAHRLGWTPAQQGHYFRLRSKGLEGRFVAYQPGPGTRAYQGNDAVAMFSQRQPHAEIIPTRCDRTAPDDQVTFVTGDGLLLTLCQDPQDEERFSLRRVGWRFSSTRWQEGLALGKSATNDIVMGSALLPINALRLRMQGRRLHITQAPQEARYPKQHRLLCFGHQPAPPPTPPTKPSTTPHPEPVKPEHPIETRCQQDAFFLESGSVIKLFSKHHPEHAVTLQWSPATQEKGAYDLRITPTNGTGLSRRRLSLATLRAQGASDFVVGNAEIYFRSIRPNAVRTHDLDDLVHELLLRRILEYAEPDALRASLRTRYQAQLALEEVASRAPMALWLPQLQALTHNRYLRNRIWMANHSLAQHYRLQARNLFRIRFGRQEQPGELLGLGTGGATLRAPRQNLLQPHTAQSESPKDIRLSTILTANDTPTPYLQRLNPKEVPIPGSLIWLRQQPTELLVQSGSFSGNRDVSPEIAKRKFQAQSTALQARTILWRGQEAYTSHHPYAYQNPSGRPAIKPGQAPTQFLYTLQGRWWKRTPTQQQSSLDWPITAVAARLGTLLTQEQLAQALMQLNTAPYLRKKRQHCGNESLREAGKWRHRQRCWGDAILARQGTSLLVPCSPLVRSKVRERFCQPGTPTPHIDPQGQPMLPTLSSIDGLYGVVLLPAPVTSQRSPSYQLQMLPGTLPIRLDASPLAPGKWYPLRDQARLQLGELTFQFRQPTGQLATAHYRGEYITSHYPEGPVFAHAIAGSVGGPFRSDPKALKAQLPKASGKASPGATPRKPSSTRQLATTLASDLQRTAYAVASQHFARMNSAAFQRQFRRRYINNPHKPHAGAVVMLNRHNGQVLTSLSFPSFDPNLPPYQSQISDDQRTYRYLRGQIVDRYGITDALLAYRPSRLPPNPPKAKRLQGRPDEIPDFVQALQWDREEELRGIRGDARSGWLLERAFGGAQTPGSTAKLVTAIAYARYLRRKGRPGAFPKHTCHGGLMFMRQRKGTHKGHDHWRPSTIRFRCHKRQGHGQVGLQQAMASSCNVYFAKLALEMAGTPPPLLRQGEVRWLRNRHGGQGRYQMLRIPRDTISNAMRRDPTHRTLFRTAAKLGFAMRYTYRQKKQVARYTDAFWEPPMTSWPLPPANLSATQRTAWLQQARNQRQQTLLPGGSFGQGRYFGHAAAYPAWQQWVHGATEPRHRHPTSTQRTFGSTDASLRAMAYIGFGQGLIATPLRLALLSSAIANGGWLPLPQLWRGPWKDQTPPPSPTRELQRPKPVRVLHSADAKILQQALAAVTMNGTAGQPLGQLNRQCLHPLGLQVIGKTGTAEDRSQRARALLRDKVRQAGARFRLPANRKWFQESGCHRRTFWRYYYPEENIADSLFVGAITPYTPGSSAQPPQTGKGWRLQDLAFALVVKNGYHPEGVPCRRKGQDLDRSEARYLAHDILLAAIQKLGACRDYRDTSRPQTFLTAPKTKRRSRRKSTRKPKARRNARARGTRPSQGRRQLRRRKHPRTRTRRR